MEMLLIVLANHAMLIARSVLDLSSLNVRPACLDFTLRAQLASSVLNNVPNVSLKRNAVLAREGIIYTFLLVDRHVLLTSTEIQQ